MNNNSLPRARELRNKISMYKNALKALNRQDKAVLTVKDRKGTYRLVRNTSKRTAATGMVPGINDIELIKQIKPGLAIIGKMTITPVPVWLRLVRRKGLIENYYSQDGHNWKSAAIKHDDFLNHTVRIGITNWEYGKQTYGKIVFTSLQLDNQQIDPARLRTVIIGTCEGSIHTSGYEIVAQSKESHSTIDGDALPFCYMEVSGDFDVKVQLVSITGNTFHSHGALMIRNDLSPLSYFAALAVNRTNSLGFYRRAAHIEKANQLRLRHRQDLEIMEKGVSFYEELSWIIIKKYPIFNKKGEVTGLASLNTNIGDRNHLSNNLAEGVVRMDGEGIIKCNNETAERIFNLTFSQIHRKHLHDVYQPTDMNRKPARSLLETVKTKAVTIKRDEDLIFINNDNQEFILEETWCSFAHPQTKKVHQIVLILNDVTENRKLLRQVTYQAQHDVLTGLFNRLAFEEKLEELIRNARQEQAVHTFLFLDLDNFKPINDTAGHLAGDMMLKQIADIIKDCLRNSDYAARLGGDEFAALLPFCEQKYAIVVAKKILESIYNHRLLWEDGSWSVQASIGLVSFNDKITNKQTLITMADTAAYNAKRAGGNRVEVYNPLQMLAGMMPNTAVTDVMVLSCMDEDSFRLAAQNVVQSNDAGSIIYKEVFLRAPEDRELPPSAVFPVMRRSGKSLELDTYILKKAIRAVHDGAITPPIGINLEPETLSNDNFLSLLADISKERAENLSAVYFEIDEQTLINSFGRLQQLSDIMRPRGSEFIVDNISGSLHVTEYCRMLKVFAVKLDPALITGISENKDRQILIKHVEATYRELGIHVIAKHIEDGTTLARLKKLQIAGVQGHAVGKPVFLT